MALLPRVLAPAVALAVLLTCLWLGGTAGLLYSCLFALWLLPGVPVGCLIFGARHPAGWLTGAVLGYPLTALALWVPLALGVAGPNAFGLAWLLVTVLSWTLLWPNRQARVELQPWTSADAIVLALLVLAVPAMVGRPFSRVGEPDATGTARYRAYFTADFLWHMALTAELEKLEQPPRNPYLASESLHYYWLYFVPPSAAARALPRIVPPRAMRLAINAMLAGVLFVIAIYLLARTAVPRAGPAGLGVLIGLVASSAEGAWALIRLWDMGAPLGLLRELNVDALTMWWRESFTFDGLQRSLLYNIHHATGCASALVALAALSAAGASLSGAAALAAGAALGMGLMMSPFPGGALTLSFALALVANLPRTRDRWGAWLRTGLLSGAPVALALLWSVYVQTFEGAGGDLVLGIPANVRHAPVSAMLLAAGPLLVPALIGLAIHWRLPRSLRPAACAMGVAMALLSFLSLQSAVVWIGWRAGQVLLVTAPALAAAGFAALWQSSRWRRAGGALAAVALIVGLPTTVIDLYNAQDVTNDQMGPGFRWTVEVTPEEQAALAWIRERTRPSAIVQMEPTVRGRETWTLIPSFGERRMAAGLPISLLNSPEYEARSLRVRELYETPDPELAWSIARDLGIHYLYVDRVEREAYPEADAKFERRADLFAPVFGNGEARIFWVVPGRPLSSSGPASPVSPSPIN